MMRNKMGNRFSRTMAAAIAALGAFYGTAAQAAGDLLVAPTRLVLGEKSGGEVLLSNKGAEAATYRTSIILKRMLEDGRVEDITQPTPEQQQLIDMVSYAPRKVVLAPGQTQTVRVAASVPPSWAAGEYRVHMLFRAVPAEGQLVAASKQEGVAIALTPVYGVTIPVVVRKGAPDAKVGIENARISRSAGKAALTLTLLRSGNRSIYGAVRLFQPGDAKPLAELRGVAVYEEVGRRAVTLDIPDTNVAKLSGPMIVRFNEEGDGGGKATAEAALTL